MLKKLLALLLCAVLAFALVACTETGTPGTDTGAGNTEQGSDNSGAGGSSDAPAVDLGGYDEDMDHVFLATDIKNHAIVIFDLSLSSEEGFADLKDCVVWEWDSDEDSNCKGNPGAGLDAAKLRYSPYYEKDVIIACSSGGWAGVIDYKARTVLWEWAPGSGNFHSIEMMPNGDVVIAGSSDDGRIYYVPLSAGETKPCHTIDSPHGHGVMWDPQNEWLWVLDYDEVYACTVSGTGKDTKLARISGYEAPFDKNPDGHVLSPVYGEPGKYWVTSSARMYQFDAETVELSPASSAYNDKTVKGIAYFPDKTMVMSVAGSGDHTYDWSCGEIRIVLMVPSEGKVTTLVPRKYNIAVEGREFYKVHPLTKDYQ